jgi:hypothetical protein
MPAVVSKRGVDENKVGALPSRHKKAINIISYLQSSRFLLDEAGGGRVSPGLPVSIILNAVFSYFILIVSRKGRRFFWKEFLIFVLGAAKKLLP